MRQFFSIQYFSKFLKKVTKNLIFKMLTYSSIWGMNIAEKNDKTENLQNLLKEN